MGGTSRLRSLEFCSFKNSPLNRTVATTIISTPKFHSQCPLNLLSPETIWSRLDRVHINGVRLKFSIWYTVSFFIPSYACGISPCRCEALRLTALPVGPTLLRHHEASLYAADVLRVYLPRQHFFFGQILYLSARLRLLNTHGVSLSRALHLPLVSNSTQHTRIRLTVASLRSCGAHVLRRTGGSEEADSADVHEVPMQERKESPSVG